MRDEDIRTSLYEYSPGRYVLGVEDPEATAQAIKAHQRRKIIEVSILIGVALITIRLVMFYSAPLWGWALIALLTFRSIRCLRPSSEPVVYKTWDSINMN